MTAKAASSAAPWTGGCQCGAIRFRVGRLGRASLCHCRMCQKAFGGIGGLLVTAHDVAWTRGAPAHFQSSDDVRRGFCRDCGTPLTFEYKSYLNIAIAAFDRAAEITPTIQLAREARLPWVDHIGDLPLPPETERAAMAKRIAAVVSKQHPDRDIEASAPPTSEQ